MTDNLKLVTDNLKDDLDLEKSYRELGGDRQAEAEALEWSEQFIGDIDDEPWYESLGNEAKQEAKNGKHTNDI